MVPEINRSGLYSKEKNHYKTVNIGKETRKKKTDLLLLSEAQQKHVNLAQ